LETFLSEQQSEITIQELREMARYFHALKDILRLRILITLAERGEMTVTELAQMLRVSQPLISFHLRPLRLIDLVQVRRVGREVYCSVNLSEIQRRQDEFMQLLASAQV
jgi:DNA-binding transcriptional ArsR family regulator